MFVHEYMHMYTCVKRRGGEDIAMMLIFLLNNKLGIKEKNQNDMMFMMSDYSINV